MLLAKSTDCKIVHVLPLFSSTQRNKLMNTLTVSLDSSVYQHAKTMPTNENGREKRLSATPDLSRWKADNITNEHELTKSDNVQRISTLSNSTKLASTLFTHSRAGLSTSRSLPSGATSGLHSHTGSRDSPKSTYAMQRWLEQTPKEEPWRAGVDM
ncbi:hypothetical protein N7G274_010394 [Stereocaulon virgatum]|uniref:Uncharacterized protein n=1 Tax=Stereocaulon virgatum TaxID=373712 RepID=A0ABR3ZVD7_9LECA